MSFSHRTSIGRIAAAVATANTGIQVVVVTSAAAVVVVAQVES